MPSDPVEVAICEVVVTAGDGEWLASLTRTLIEDRLVACGHHLAAIRSLYRWEGAIEDAAEARVAWHTRTTLIPQIVARVKVEHPYEVPCVIALPVLAANPDYVAWVERETRPG